MISICEQNTGRWYVLPRFHLIFHVTRLPGRENCFLDYVSISGANYGQAKQWQRGRNLYSGGFSLGMISIILGDIWQCSKMAFGCQNWGWGTSRHLVIGTGDAAKHPVRYRAALCDEIHSQMSTVERWRSPGVPWCMSCCLCRQNVTHHHTFPAAHHQVVKEQQVMRC